MSIQVFKRLPRWEVWKDGVLLGLVDKIDRGEWVVNCIPEGCACLSHALIYHSRTEAVEALVKG